MQLDGERNKVWVQGESVQPSFAEWSEEPPPELLPPLDQPTINETALSPTQIAWRRDGVLILPRFLPDKLMDAYS
jgi:hypothetical protein